MGTDEAWRPVYKAPFIRTFRPPSTIVVAKEPHPPRRALDCDSFTAASRLWNASARGLSAASTLITIGVFKERLRSGLGLHLLVTKSRSLFLASNQEYDTSTPIPGCLCSRYAASKPRYGSDQNTEDLLTRGSTPLQKVVLGLSTCSTRVR